MPDFFATVVPKPQQVSEARFHALVVAAWARIAAKHGRGALADKAHRSTRALDKVFAGSTPEAKALFDTLLLDISALDEVAAAYGVRIIPAQAEAANDLTMLADAAALHAEHMNALRDGHRDYRETIKIAEKARPVVAEYSAIIEEADHIRGAA